MKLKLWQVDAFAEKPFEGNPAGIVPLDRWIDAGLMQKIANENNLAETAFFVKTAPGRYELRWFTPTVEVPLCGHATLASAWTIFEILDPSLKAVSFETQSGTLAVERGANGLNAMSLPSNHIAPFQPSPDYPLRIAKALDSATPSEVLKGANIVAVFDKASEVRNLAGAGRIADAISSDMGLIATAPGDEGFDFISRYFAPHHGIPEDPVTGSAHCALTPYWAKRLDKKTMRARQVSPRGGNLICTDAGNRTVLQGRCALYLTGEIEV
ncbi:MAG TPA: PhzF family phenazine biosynthesis protein [Rhizomicrobium sp.]|nr:PhzF family phenazine biosynthesis protein [Rhizomicrobium sp.]